MGKSLEQKFREVLFDHAKYREAYAPFNRDAVLDHTWMSGPAWSPATKSLWQFTETMLYQSEYDGAIKLAMKNRKSPVEIFDFGTIKVVYDECLEARRKELFFM